MSTSTAPVTSRPRDIASLAPLVRLLKVRFFARQRRRRQSIDSTQVFTEHAYLAAGKRRLRTSIPASYCPNRAPFCRWEDLQSQGIEDEQTPTNRLCRWHRCIGAALDFASAKESSVRRTG